MLAVNYKLIDSIVHKVLFLCEKLALSFDLPQLLIIYVDKLLLLKNHPSQFLNLVIFLNNQFHSFVIVSFWLSNTIDISILFVGC